MDEIFGEYQRKGQNLREKVAQYEKEANAFKASLKIELDEMEDTEYGWDDTPTLKRKKEKPFWKR